MIKFAEVILALVLIVLIVGGAAVLARILTDKWYEYSMQREFGKMVEKEQRRYCRR